jgi:2-oxo-3-hexenedioate decarboxylase
MADLEAFAVRLDAAAESACAIAQISDEHPALTIDEAYRVQGLGIGMRVARNERVVGFKMGFTSRAKMVQMGVSEPVYGRLTDAMQVPCGGCMHGRAFIHPRAEPEIAVVLKRRLAGVVTAFQAAAAIEAVAPALEIIDSRYRDFKFRLSDVVADNSSASAFVLGSPQPYGEQVANLGVVLAINGRVAQAGSTAAILGHPLRSLIEAARLAALQGEALEQGDVVLLGAATAAEPIGPGCWVQARVQGMDRVSVKVQ